MKREYAMIIKNACIHTMNGQTIENGYIKIENEKIKDIGNMRTLKETDEETIDLKGANIYPGFIDAHTHLGMWEDGLGFEGDDGNEDTDPSTPQMRAIDAINPVDKCFKEALDFGITSVLTGPGSSNSIGGQITAIKTYGSRIDDMIIKSPVAIKMALGENPKTTYHEKSQTPSTRMATAAVIREQLNKAKRYMESLQEYYDDSEAEKPEYDIKCESLLPLMKREIPAMFHAHRCDDIFTAIRLSKEFNIRYKIIHGTGGYKAAEILKNENVEIMAGPLICDRSKPELRDLDLIAPSVYERYGIKFSIVTDHPVVPIQYLIMSAALSVREGLSHDEALKAITINAAQICEIDDRVGSIEIGKDADMVAFTGDPLDIMSKPCLVICSGKVVRDSL